MAIVRPEEATRLADLRILGSARSADQNVSAGSVDFQNRSILLYPDLISDEVAAAVTINHELFHFENDFDLPYPVGREKLVRETRSHAGSVVFCSEMRSRFAQGGLCGNAQSTAFFSLLCEVRRLEHRLAVAAFELYIGYYDLAGLTGQLPIRLTIANTLNSSLMREPGYPALGALGNLLKRIPEEPKIAELCSCLDRRHREADAIADELGWRVAELNKLIS